MPVFIAEVAETHLRINRPVIKQVIDDILKRFKDIPFREYRFLGESEQLQTPGSAFDGGAFNRSNADNHVDVEVDDRADEEYYRSYTTNAGQNQAFISCPKTLLDMFPIYENRKIVISLKVVCSSRVRLNGLITNIRQGMRQSETLFTHQISYDYDLPVACSEILNQIYHLMEKQYGYGLGFIDWLKEIKQRHVQMSTRLDGERGMLTIRENGVNVLSNLVEHEDAPDKNRDNNNGVWYTEIDVELRYQRPNAVRCSYPPVINNQFLPEGWFNQNHTYMYRDEKASASLANLAMEAFKWNLNFSTPGSANIGVKEPSFDDWGKELHNKKMLKLVTSLVMVDLNDPQQFFNIGDDIVDHTLPLPILKLISHYPSAIAFEGKHIIHVKAYKGNDPIPAECLQIDKDLNVRLDHVMDPRGYYHLVTCLNIDPTTIPTEVWETMHCDVEGLAIYFSYFGEKYRRLVQYALDQMADDEMCLNQSIIDDIIREIIDDHKDNDFDNIINYRDSYARRTKLNYHVLGEIL